MRGASLLTLLVGGEGVVIRHNVHSTAQGAYCQMVGRCLLTYFATSTLPQMQKSELCVLCTVHCAVIIQQKPTKCTIF